MITIAIAIMINVLRSAKAIKNTRPKKHKLENG